MEFRSRVGIALAIIWTLLSSSTSAVWSDSDAITNFQEYLRIRSDQPSPDYAAATAWIRTQCEALGLKIQETAFVEKKPVLTCTVAGSNANLPSFVFNSHMDVVPPGDPSKWDSPAFEAQISKDDFIVARGSQDMKCVGIQYLLAVDRLLASGWKPDRDVHVTFVPDEEIGGHDGMGEFVKSSEFKKLNVGALMDEGLPSQGSSFSLFYAERRPWWLVMRAEGLPGHGATLPETTASQVLLGAVNKALEYRETQYRLVQDGKKGRGDVVGVNLVALEAGRPNGKGGYISNVIPNVAEAYFDLRVPPSLSKTDMENIISGWMECDGAPCTGMSHRYNQKVILAKTTSLDASESEWAAKLKKVGRELGLEFTEEIFPAATDARYVREVDIPAFGFSPINGSADLLHKDNERLSRDVFVRGVGIYEKIIAAMGGVGNTGDDEEEAEL